MNLQAKITTGVGIVLVAGGVAIGFALSGSPASHAQPVDQPIVTDATTATVTEAAPTPTPTDTVVAVTTPATVEAPVTQPDPTTAAPTDEVAHGNTVPAGPGLPPVPLPAPKPAFTTAYYGPGATPSSTATP